MVKTPRVRRYIVNLREFLVSAIRDGDSDKTRSGLELYRRLVTTFYEHLSSFGVVFGPEEARAESRWIPQAVRWQEIEWIQEDYRTLVREGFRAPHRDILSSLLYFPYAIAGRAAQEMDCFTIEKFLFTFTTLPYFLSRRLDDTELREFVARKLAAHPRDFVRFNLSRILETAETPEQVDNVFDLAERIVQKFNSLMKAAVDTENLDDLDSFNSELTGLFSGVHWELPGFRRWRAMRGAQQNSGDFEFAEDLPRDSDIYERFDLRNRQLGDLTRLVRFGLKAWYVKGKVETGQRSEVVQSWLETFGSPWNFDNLINVYAASLDFEIQDACGWDNWILEGAPEGQAITVNVDPILDRKFILEAAKFLARDSYNLPSIPEDIDRARVLARAASEEGHLRSSLEAMLGEWERWDPYVALGPDVLRRRILDLTEHITEEFEEYWQAQVMVSGLSTERVEDFQASVLEGYEGQEQLKKVCRDLELYKEVSREEGEVDPEAWRGFNMTLPKEWFVPESNVMVGPAAEDIGRQRLRSEERTVFGRILRGADRRVVHSGEAQRLDAIGVEVKKIDKRGGNPIVVVINSWRTYHEIVGSDDFTPERDGRSREGRRSIYIGRWKDVPVYRIHLGRHERAVVVNKGKWGEWLQYQPTKEAYTEYEVLDNVLKVSLDPISEEKAEEWVVEGPNRFGIDEADPDEERVREKIRELRNKVHFRFFSSVGWKPMPDAEDTIIEWREAS